MVRGSSVRIVDKRVLSLTNPVRYRSTHSVLQRASLQFLLIRAPLGIVSGLAEKVDGEVLIGVGKDGGGESELVNILRIKMKLVSASH